MAKSKSTSSPTASHNILVKDAIVDGNVSSLFDIRVDGIINGNLICKSKLVLGALGKIYGNVDCQNAIVEGEITGNLTVQQMLDIRKTAHIEGDIESSKLIVEEGAFFLGKCKMIPHV
jgi:cytoskeletal protein CcmA (bactofilin family)